MRSHHLPHGLQTKTAAPWLLSRGGVSTTKGKTKKNKNTQVQEQDVSSDYKPHKQNKALYVTLCLTCKQRLRPHVLFQGPPPHNNPYLQTKTAAPCVVPRPPPTTTPTCKQRLRPRVLFQGPPHNNPHLQTKTAAPCVVPRPPHNNPHLQTKTVAPCVVPRPPPFNNLLVVVEWYGTNGSYKQRLEPRGTATA